MGPNSGSQNRKKKVIMCSYGSAQSGTLKSTLREVSFAASQWGSSQNRCCVQNEDKIWQKAQVSVDEELVWWLERSRPPRALSCCPMHCTILLLSIEPFVPTVLRCPILQTSKNCWLPLMYSCLFLLFSPFSAPFCPSHLSLMFSPYFKTLPMLAPPSNHPKACWVDVRWGPPKSSSIVATCVIQCMLLCSVDVGLQACFLEFF